MDASQHGEIAPDIFERSLVTFSRDLRTRTTWLHFDYGGRAHRLFAGRASGRGNNCLIDTLRQVINDQGLRIVADVTWVRLQLQARFNQITLAQVTEWSYLDLKEHWAAVIDLLGQSARSNGLDEQGQIRHDAFTVVGISAEDSRIVAREGSGRIVLFVLNRGQAHFEPLLKDRRPL